MISGGVGRERERERKRETQRERGQAGGRAGKQTVRQPHEVRYRRHTDRRIDADTGAGTETNMISVPIGST